MKANSEATIYLSYDDRFDEGAKDRFVDELRAKFGDQVKPTWATVASLSDQWLKKMREAIRSADKVVVICGEQSGSSPKMFAEVVIAQEERKPYALLWASAPADCTRPNSRLSTDKTYVWNERFFKYFQT